MIIRHILVYFSSLVVGDQFVWNGANVTFDEELLEAYGTLTWNGFRKKYKNIDPDFGSKLEEHYRKG